MNPYKDLQISSDLKIRTFDPDDIDEESTWHRDKNDRKVVILESAGWKFQREDEMPIQLIPGDVLTIQSHTWHRVLPGSGRLVTLISEIKTLSDI